MTRRPSCAHDSAPFPPSSDPVGARPPAPAVRGRRRGRFYGRRWWAIGSGAEVGGWGVRRRCVNARRAPESRGCRIRSQGAGAAAVYLPPTSSTSPRSARVSRCRATISRRALANCEAASSAVIGPTSTRARRVIWPMASPSQGAGGDRSTISVAAVSPATAAAWASLAKRGRWYSAATSARFPHALPRGGDRAAPRGSRGSSRAARARARRTPRRTSR